MKNRVTYGVSVLVVLLSIGSATLFAQDAQSGNGKPEPPMAGVHWAKGQGPGNPGKTSSPNLIDHGGSILTTTSVTAIFWGSSWGTSAGDKISGIDTFYSGIGGSGYARSSDEYTGGGSQVGSSIAYVGHSTDPSAAVDGTRTGPILSEVCKLFPHPVANAYYPVYVDIKRGHAGFCAWHSTGSCGGTTVEFGFFFNLDGDAACDPQDTLSSHSQGLAALANVSGHEISETRTDPNLDAWYDNSGNENADKCAWTFGPAALLLPFSNGSQWKIQGNWSNAAYTAGPGYANSSGQKGCIESN